MPVLATKSFDNQRGPTRHIEHWHPGETCCDDHWEAAYARFETPHQEVRKFVRRLRRLGVHRWDKSWDVVELFCGRGSGLLALKQVGFHRIAGVDLSPRLLAQYEGAARLYVGDCRDLKFDEASQDLVVVQGGLHHLPCLPDDLSRVLAEIRRVLRPGGRVVFVEPWLTPFLRLVHWACGNTWARRSWSKLDALAVMIDQERETYEQWLGQGESIRQLLDAHFRTLRLSTAFGKLTYVGESV